MAVGLGRWRVGEICEGLCGDFFGRDRPDGMIEKISRKVKPASNAEEIFADVAELSL